ncbi:MAG: 4-alpha-glucanotransferase, partial [Phycisphaerae bacterium]
MSARRTGCRGGPIYRAKGGEASGAAGAGFALAHGRAGSPRNLFRGLNVRTPALSARPGSLEGVQSVSNGARSAGILVHVTSLPGAYGIGDLGPAARAFVDWLRAARQRWWQVLPLGPAGAGDSPYQCYSAVAGDPRLISPDDLLRDGLATRAEVKELARRDGANNGKANFAAAALKLELVARAAERMEKTKLRRAFEAFREQNAEWLDDYALFMALRERSRGAWQDWPADIVTRKPRALEAARRELAERVAVHQLAQFLFFRQLDALRAYARDRGVRLIGDLPIYVSPDSADVWARPELFLLDRTRRPTAVAGVPPDYFSETGQRWGNPLYDWAAMRRDRFAWWIDRVRATLRQVDLVRVDHFRGFAGYYRIPAHLPTAVGGRWVKAPGPELFQTLQRELTRSRLRRQKGSSGQTSMSAPPKSMLPFIAEDLGVITPDVEKLRDDFGLPGMRVLQFAFGGPGD